jgi:ABC-2 type transport system ATP-binding protein
MNGEINKVATIQVEKLSRRFKELQAVDNLNFSVDEGEIFGFLGPNGAGKTTTIRMLTGQLSPTTGQANVAGCDVNSEYERLKPLIGVVSEYQNLYARMTARENLMFAAQLYNVDRRQVETMLELVRIHDRAKDPVKNFSNGMKQRLLIARALLHNPKVLFLDEPTRGLDPIAAREIRELIIKLSHQGTTIFLTTHYMEEADQLCRRIAFISQGKIAAMDTPENLKIAHGQKSVDTKLKDGTSRKINMEQGETSKQLAELISSGQVLTLHSEEATLEEVFIKLTGKRLVS